jgi:formate C-acetyltransferase
MGKALEDARLYVGGGCQENVLQNTEINSRASIYLNLAHVLLMGFFPERWAPYTDAAGIHPQTYEGAEDFEEFRGRFLANLEAVVNDHIEVRNATEREGWWWNPCPLHSSTLDDCIENAKDMMAGGTRYAGASVSLIGVGTLVDSLRAIEQLVFEEQRVSLAELAAGLESDFAGQEPLRQYALNRVPKYGSEDGASGEFAARVFADLARIASGQPNTRGGRYEASVFAYRSFVGMGRHTGATPDGRRAGEPLSPGMGPSPLALRGGMPLLDTLAAIDPVDLAAYPVAAVLDAKLPWTAEGVKPEAIVAVLRYFMGVGGSVLQLNVVDPAALLDARKHPERHGDLVVRVSGYSARFTTLPHHIQNEIIQRELARVR